MDYVEVQEDFPFLPEIDERPEGPHVGTIINDLLMTSGMNLGYKPSGKPDLDENGKRIISDSLKQTFERGFLWERTLSRVFCETNGTQIGDIERPPPYRKQGIWCSPDGLLHDAEGPIIAEFKSTAKSSTGIITAQTSWMMQTMAYCYALNTNRVIFRNWYLMGDYKEHRHAQYKRFDIRFTLSEISENWGIISRHGLSSGMVTPEDLQKPDGFLGDVE